MMFRKEEKKYFSYSLILFQPTTSSKSPTTNIFFSLTQHISFHFFCARESPKFLMSNCIIVRYFCESDTNVTDFCLRQFSFHHILLQTMVKNWMPSSQYQLSPTVLKKCGVHSIESKKFLFVNQSNLQYQVGVKGKNCI